MKWYTLMYGDHQLNQWKDLSIFFLFVDDFSRMSFLYLMKSKSEVPNIFKDFHMHVKTQFQSNIKVLRSDNGTEFLSNNMLQYISSQGIIHQTSCVGTPQQNGVAERKNRDLLEKTRALMLHMHVPKKFWSFVILTATYLINQLPSRVLEYKSPYEILKGRKIDLTHLKVFGCVCFVHIQALNRDKLDARATKCVFMGYSSTQKGYKCFNPVTKKVHCVKRCEVRRRLSLFHFQRNYYKSGGGIV